MQSTNAAKMANTIVQRSGILVPRMGTVKVRSPSAAAARGERAATRTAGVERRRLGRKAAFIAARSAWGVLRGADASTARGAATDARDARGATERPTDRTAEACIWVAMGAMIYGGGGSFGVDGGTCFGRVSDALRVEAARVGDWERQCRGACRGPIRADTALPRNAREKRNKKGARLGSPGGTRTGGSAPTGSPSGDGRTPPASGRPPRRAGTHALAAEDDSSSNHERTCCRLRRNATEVFLRSPRSRTAAKPSPAWGAM